VARSRPRRALPPMLAVRVARVVVLATVTVALAVGLAVAVLPLEDAQAGSSRYSSAAPEVTTQAAASVRGSDFNTRIKRWFDWTHHRFRRPRHVPSATPSPTPAPTSTYTESPAPQPTVSQSQTTKPAVTQSPSPNPTTKPTTPKPTLSASETLSPSPTATASTAGTTTPSPQPGGWPDESNTGVAGCPPLTRVDGPEVTLRQDGMVYENKEVHGAVIRILAHNVTIRCVKIVGIGWYGIDNTDRPSPSNTYTDVVVDRVDVDCQNKGFVVGLLLQAATISRANVHHCDHMMNVGGDNVIIKDSYCHDLTKLPGKDVHADCIQSMGGNVNLTIQHNALWSWDTSDILLGQEYGDARNVVVDNNRLMSDPDQSPPPAYLLYVSGTNTKITNNRFSRRYTYGPCTLNTAASNITWSNNVWDDDGSQIPFSKC
jgi:hypothetical protein